MSEKIVQLNEEGIKGQIKELVRGSVEETLNDLLEAEAEKLTQAARYERSKERRGCRSGHYSRSLTTTSGDVTLNVPRLKGVAFETAIIERYRRRESSVEEALIEMYPSGEWRTSRRLYGAAKYHRPPSASSTRKPMSPSRPGGTDRCRVANIHMSMWMASTCAAIGAASTRTYLFWWQSRLTRTATVRFWVLPKA